MARNVKFNVIAVLGLDNIWYIIFCYILTNHDGGVSLERIKWTLPLAILFFVLKCQLSICVGLQEQTH